MEVIVMIFKTMMMMLLFFDNGKPFADLHYLRQAYVIGVVLLVIEP